MFPGAAFLIGLATLSGMLFYLTSANSGAMVMSNFSSRISDPGADGPKWLRIYWAVLTAVLTIAMLMAGGVTTMEYATLIFALPVTIIAYLVMLSFSKVLRMERAEREGWARMREVSGRGAAGRTWRQRLTSMRTHPSAEAVARFSAETIAPALEEFAAELREHGQAAEVRRESDAVTGIGSLELAVPMGANRDFRYRVSAVSAPIPAIGSKASRGRDDYLRLEVFSQTGSAGYDLYGMTQQQVLGDVLDSYEAHLAFLNYSLEHDSISAVSLAEPVEVEAPVDAEQR